jgi:mannose-6-phosphate isomerase-like protein (cupin superfamily)
VNTFSGPGAKILLFLSLLASGGLLAQDRTVDPTWLRRSVPSLAEAKTPFTSASCHYTPIFGEGDSGSKTLKSISRFGEVTVDPHGKCDSVFYPREEELYFVLKGRGTLQFGDEPHPLRARDFSYISPAVKHALTNEGTEPLTVVVMGFKIPSRVVLSPPLQQPRIVNLDAIKEEPVQGHPTSVLYKLMVGPRKATRDAIDDAYVITSLFWMDFAPGGTNFPHHHETAEEIYLVVDGEGQMVAGGGMDGIEGRFPSKPGDAYYFRPNCTVGFYNENKAGAKAHILAVRSLIPLSGEED